MTDDIRKTFIEMAIKKMDADKVKAKGGEEKLRKQMSSEDFGKIFDSMDRDKDGHLSLKELEKGICDSLTVISLM